MNIDTLTRYEISRILGARALQLAMNAPPLVKPKSDDTFLNVAEKELLANVIPLGIIVTKKH